MQSNPTDSPATAKSMLVPPIVPTLVLYGAFILISRIPELFPGDPYLRHFWVALPLGFVGFAVPVLLFLSVFAINEKRAILVPICGVLGAALLSHYLSPGEVAQGFEEVALRNDLWAAIKNQLPTALLVSGLAVVAARWWAPRTEEDSARFVIPPITPALILFACSVAVFFVIAVANTEGELFFYPVMIVATAAQSFAIIAMCSVCAVALKGWTALLPLVITVASFAPFYLRPSYCAGGGLGDGGGCWDFVWPLLRTELFALAALFVLSVLAGAFAREEAAPSAEPALAPEG